MARPKAGSVTKSHSIREYLTANPKSKAREVVAALGKTGVKVNEGLVYAVKGSMKERKRRKARVVKAARAAMGTGVDNGFVKSDALTMILEVRALAKKAGGFAQLKGLVDALAE